MLEDISTGGVGGAESRRYDHTFGSQYYDAADASIDYEWAVAVEFESQA